MTSFVCVTVAGCKLLIRSKKRFGSLDKSYCICIMSAIHLKKESIYSVLNSLIILFLHELHLLL